MQATCQILLPGAGLHHGSTAGSGLSKEPGDSAPTRPFRASVALTRDATF